MVKMMAIVITAVTTSLAAVYFMATGVTVIKALLIPTLGHFEWGTKAV